MINFIIEKENKILYDLNGIKNLLNISKSKAHRMIIKSKIEFIPFKNLKLYDEVAIMTLMEILFMERITKI